MNGLFRHRLEKIHKKLSDSFTIMFIPHSQQGTYSTRISYLIPLMILVVLAGVMLSVSLFSLKYIGMKENMDELNTLRAVSAKQQEQLKTLEMETQNLQSKMVELIHLERDVREMLNRSETASRSGMDISRINPPDSILIDEPTNIEEKKSPLLILQREASFREKQAQWDSTYDNILSSTEVMAEQIDEISQSMALLKSDVVATEHYYASRPVGLPANGNISSGYGYRSSPFTGRRDFHPGLDIAAPHGAPVYATGQGEVIFSGYRGGYGYTIEIRHPYGFTTLYAHNSRNIVKVGDTVSRGNVIARVGSSGASTGPHVHYEIFLNGVRVDPTNYLR